MKRDESVCHDPSPASKDTTGMADDLRSLKENEAWFKAVFESAMDGIILGDAETGRLSMPNPRICEMLGYSARELSGLSVSDIHPPEDLPSVTRFFLSLAKGEISVARDVPILRKDGEVRYVDVSGKPVSIGKRACVLGIFHDVTDRWRIEEKLQQSEAQARAICDTATDAIFIKDAERRYTFLNPAAISLLGGSAEAILGKTPEELYDPDTARFIREADDATFAGNAHSVERRMRIGDRNYVLHAVQTPIRDAKGEVVAICGIVRDVTARRDAEEALQQVRDELERRVAERTAALGESGERLRLALESGRVGACDWDLRTNRIFTDERFRSLFGLTNGSDGLDSETLFLRIHPEDRIKMGKRLAISIRQGVRFQQEFRIALPDGTVRWVSGSGQAIPHRGAARARFVALVRDITREREEEIERRHLERQVLRASENERLRIGQDLHDGLGQVLAGIRFTALALHTKLASRKMPEARQVAHIAEYLSNAIGQCRDLAGVLHPLTNQPEALRLGLRSLAEFTREMFDVHCRVNCSPHLRVSDPAVATHLYRIAQEAVHNAARHGKATEITVTLRREKAGLKLIVKDNGAGFPNHPQKRSGIGLPTMHYRANAMGGTLEVVSGPQAGVTVTCRVP